MTEKVPTIVLKAAEARGQDVGRGVARLDPKDMERIEASVGEIVELSGKKKTVDPKINDIIKGHKEDFELSPDDVVMVPERFF